MKNLITKRNFFFVICIVYTCVNMSSMLIEIIFFDIFTKAHLNSLTIFYFCTVVVFVLSQHERIFRLPLILAALIQYLMVEFLMLSMVWIGGHFGELAKSAYRDIFISTTTFYIAISIIYYIYFYLELKKYNVILKKIKQQTQKPNSQ